MDGIRGLVAERRAKTFFAIFFSLYSVAIAIQSLLPSYLNFKASEALSFNVADGWCTPSRQGIGTHCFGDFYYTLRFVNLDNPWSTSPNPYPPVSLLFYKPFAFLVGHFPASRLPLLLYLFICLLAALLPAIHLFSTHRLSPRHALMIGAASLAAAPVLMALDRGNIQLFLLPFFYFFALSILENRWGRALIFGLILILFKPQMILLGAIFLIGRKWKFLFIWILTCPSAFLLGFFIFPQNIAGNFKAYWHQVTSYQNYGVPGALSPVNLSLSNTWSLITENPIFHFSRGAASFFPSTVTFLILVVILLNLYLVGNARSTIDNLFILFLLPILIPTTTFSYYLCMLLPLFILVSSDTISRAENGRTILRGKGAIDTSPLFMIFQNWKTAILLSGMTILLFAPWALPWSIFSKFQREAWSNIGINWFVGQFFLAALFISLLFTDSKKLILINNRRRLTSLKLLVVNEDEILK